MLQGLVLDDQQQDMVDMVRRFFATEADPATTRDWSPVGPEAARLRNAIGTDLGLAGLLANDDSTTGWTEACLILEEAGRGLVGVSLLTTFLATDVLSAAPTATTLLAEVLAGEHVAVIAPSSATVSDGAIDATVEFVIDAPVADRLLVVVTSETGDPALAEFAPDDDGVAVRELELLDQGRSVGDLELSGARPRALHPVTDETVRRFDDLLALGLAAELVGTMQRCLELSRSHATSRTQFGRPVGGFQAVKHLLAQMLVDVETSRSTTRYAAASADLDPSTLSHVASVAKAWVSDAASRTAYTAIQVHGGIGYTWEHEIQLAFKRVVSSTKLGGAASAHRELIAAAALG